MIRKIYNYIKCSYYKRILEKNCGRKLPSVKVMGEVRIEGCKLEINDNVILWPRVAFTGNGIIKIGRGSKIGQDCILFANASGGGITIGEDTIVAAQTYIIDSNHNMDAEKKIVDQGLNAEPIYIGNDVWIGANCSIIKGAKIGNHAVIGAKSLVNSDIPDNAIAFGIPAKKHRERMSMG